MNPDTIRKYLRALDDEGRAVVRSEVARWDAAKRQHNAGGRPVKLAPCPKGCGTMLTARERHSGHKCAGLTVVKTCETCFMQGSPRQHACERCWECPTKDGVLTFWASPTA